MRPLRTVMSLVLAFVCGLALVMAGAGAWVLAQQDTRGAFAANTGVLRTAESTIVVPDVATVLDRHVAARLLGADQVRVSIRSANAPVVLWLVPTADLADWVKAVPHAVVTGVGYAFGAQPVELVDVAPATAGGAFGAPGAPAGTQLPGSPPQRPWSLPDQAPHSQSLAWDRATDGEASLVLVRADAGAGLEATLTVAVVSPRTATLSWVCLVTATAALVVATVALWRWWARARRGSQTLPVPPHQLDELADLVADRLRGGSVWPTARHRDLTGELVPVPTMDLGAAPGAALHREVALDEGTRDGPAIGRTEPAIGRPADGPADGVAGESPYIYTAT